MTVTHTVLSLIQRRRVQGAAGNGNTSDKGMLFINYTLRVLLIMTPWRDERLLLLRLTGDIPIKKINVDIVSVQG